MTARTPGPAPARLFTVTLQDEAPAIGCGMRFLFAKEGRKWVYLLSPFTLRAARLSWPTWEGLKPLLINDPETRARVQAAVENNLRIAARPATRLEQQALEDER